MHRLFKNPYLNIAVISILALLIYMPTLHGHFIHDDQPNLVTNNQVQIKNLDIDSLKNAATSSGAGTLKRPISMGSFALNYYFFGESPFSFKLTNVVLHIITGILVYLVTFFLLNSISKKENINSSIWFASIVALIWMIHPLHVSTVAYVIQRMAILSTIFSLLAIMFYLIGRIKLLNKSQVWSQYFFLCIVSIVLGVFSKENAILVPILIILIEIVIFYPQTYSDSLKITAKYSFTIFSLVVLFTIFIFRQDIYSHLLEWYYSTREFTISERLYTQSRIIIHYIKWLLFPNIQEMGLFHDDIQNSTSLISPITTLLSILTICALAIFAIVIRKMIPLASLGIGWFFTGHLLESTIIPLEMVYEHRNYLPSVGLIIAVISILDKLVKVLIPE